MYKTRSSRMHMTVIRMWLRLQATEYDTQKKHLHNTRMVIRLQLSEVVQQVRHTWSNGCAATKLAAHHALQNTWAYTEMAWTGEALRPYLLTCTSTLTEWLQHRYCELGNNTRNSVIEEVGCSGSMSLLLVNHLWINTYTCNARIRTIRVQVIYGMP